MFQEDRVVRRFLNPTPCNSCQAIVFITLDLGGPDYGDASMVGRGGGSAEAYKTSWYARANCLSTPNPASLGHAATLNCQLLHPSRGGSAIPFVCPGNIPW
jgi:hypothetical protein